MWLIENLANPGLLVASQNGDAFRGLRASVAKESTPRAYHAHQLRYERRR